MAAISNYCGGCGTARPQGAQFCPSCGRVFDPATTPVAAQAAPTFQTDLARTAITVSNLNIKVGIGKLIGLIAALAIWFVAYPPMARADMVVLGVVMLVVAHLVGIFIGGRLVLWALAQ